MCGLFNKPKAPKIEMVKPAPFIFQTDESQALKAKKKGVSALTVGLQAPPIAGNGLMIP